MKKILAFSCLIFIAGCGGYHPTVNVYGRSGAVFTAPSLCLALLVCMNSKESSCFYDRDLMQTATGQQEMEECKEVGK